MGHLAASEPDAGFDLIPVLEESEDVVFLEIEVVLIDAGPELNLFDDDDFLLFLRLVGLLFLLEQELPVIHQLADGRGGAGRNLDQIEVFFAGQLLGLGVGNDADLRAIVTDEADFRSTDLFVNSIFGFRNSGETAVETARWKDADSS
jgi:hypothetical protein